MNAPMSHAAMRALGWRRTDERPWHKLSAWWEHDSGWKLVHCGHPTALRQWQVVSPEEIFVETKCTLRQGAEYVAAELEKEPFVIAVLDAPTVMKPWSELTLEERAVEGRAARAAVGLDESGKELAA